MITYQYKSKSKLLNGIHCVQCNDLEKENSSQELYIVATKKTREIRYIGRSINYWYNRPIKKHNDAYMKCLTKYPDTYSIYRFRCSDSGYLERAGLELIKDCRSWNQCFTNGFELKDEWKITIEMLCLTYNLKTNATSKKA